MMECGDYSIEFDRTGFPLIRRQNWSFAISLFPVSKYQFEQFLTDNGPSQGLYTDNWYRNLLSLNPRRNWKNWDERPWELFITGLGRKEIAPFLSYLGNGFRLPRINEWRLLYQFSNDIKKIITENISQLSKLAKLAKPAFLWLQNGLFPLTEEGLLELTEDSQQCIGKPYYTFFNNLWQPDQPREVNWEQAKRFIGFRMVKTGI